MTKHTGGMKYVFLYKNLLTKFDRGEGINGLHGLEPLADETISEALLNGGNKWRLKEQ